MAKRSIQHDVSAAFLVGNQVIIWLKGMWIAAVNYDK